MSIPPIALNPRRARIIALALTISLGGGALPHNVVAESPSVAVTAVSLGDSGSSVNELQRALIARGYQVRGGADGSFGPATQTALMAFQSGAGLAATGQLDSQTAIALGLVMSSYLGLGPGDEGRRVMDLQQQLGFAGLYIEGDVVGVFGSGTEAAVVAYQATIGVPTTGKIDAATASSLEGVSLSPARPVEPSAPAAAPAEEVTDSPDADGDADVDSLGPVGVSDEGSATDTAQQPGLDDLVGLRIGSRGDAVRHLQQLIIDAGFNVVGGADGVFGVLTASSLRSFQNSRGLDTTGAVDRATARALLGLNSDNDASGDGNDSTDEPDAADDAHDPTVSAPSTPASSLEGLRLGAIGADVRALQEALSAAGISVRGGADGWFGEATLAAVKAFQEREGLKVTGVVDRATADALTGATSAAPYAHLLGLQAGALGNTVKELQQRLIDLGVNVRGGADGIFGPATANALKDFQRGQGIAETAIVDPPTVDALSNPVRPLAIAGGGDDHGDDNGDDDDHDHGDLADDGSGFAEYGERGDRVRALQQALVDAAIPLNGGVDGIFGGATSRAVMEFQRRNGLRVTGSVDDATAAALGLVPMDAPLPPDPSSVTLEAFPMQGPCFFADTWGDPRSGGRSHEGTDIIGREGLELYAAASGTITRIYENMALAGNGVRLTTADGTYFFYAHMTHVAEGLEVGSTVQAGDVVGYNGETGNAGTAHLHFEVHPQGGAAVNPYPLLLPFDVCSVR